MDLFEKIGSLAKRRGFVYPGSEIYGGLAGTWDYGPLGVELKRNLKEEFWKTMVRRRDDVVGIDGAILMNPKVWEASGHIQSFSDPLVDCKKCKKRWREDVLEEKVCPACGGELTEPRQFNLLVEAKLGVIEGEKQTVYLRGEITQGVHVNFKNVLDSTRMKIPFGVAQVGKAFRNEITPGQFTFRSREFEQMELQFYVERDEEKSMEWMEYWKAERMKFYTSLGMDSKRLRFKDHEALAHYAHAACDIEFDTGDEWKEMEGIHHRGDWDISRHGKYSGQDFTFFDEATKERYAPFIIETSGGVDRATLFFLMNAYEEEVISEKDTRTVLHLHPKLAPYKAAIFPLVANKEQIVEKAKSIYKPLRDLYMVSWDERGNIGKRYRAQDEAGTPYCITVDYQTLEDDTVTVRDRDTMKQERMHIKDLDAFIKKSLE